MHSYCIYYIFILSYFCSSVSVKCYVSTCVVNMRYINEIGLTELNIVAHSYTMKQVCTLWTTYFTNSHTVKHTSEVVKKKNKWYKRFWHSCASRLTAPPIKISSEAALSLHLHEQTSEASCNIRELTKTPAVATFYIFTSNFGVLRGSLQSQVFKIVTFWWKYIIQSAPKSPYISPVNIYGAPGDWESHAFMTFKKVMLGLTQTCGVHKSWRAGCHLDLFKTQVLFSRIQYLHSHS